SFRAASFARWHVLLCAFRPSDRLRFLRYSDSGLRAPHLRHSFASTRAMIAPRPCRHKPQVINRPWISLWKNYRGDKFLHRALRPRTQGRGLPHPGYPHIHNVIHISTGTVFSEPSFPQPALWISCFLWITCPQVVDIYHLRDVGLTPSAAGSRS